MSGTERSEKVELGVGTDLIFRALAKARADRMLAAEREVQMTRLGGVGRSGSALVAGFDRRVQMIGAATGLNGTPVQWSHAHASASADIRHDHELYTFGFFRSDKAGKPGSVLQLRAKVKVGPTEEQSESVVAEWLINGNVFKPYVPKEILGDTLSLRAYVDDTEKIANAILSAQARVPQEPVSENALHLL